jgi:Fur family ferric uptake transcriptional regulator
VVPERQDRIIAAIRESGGRVTTARRALVSALVRADGHVTAEDLAETVQKDHPDVHLSTVYRSLDALEHIGVVDHVHLGHGRAVYHLADERHEHLVCEVCGRVQEVPDAIFEQLAAELLESYGFTIRPKHFAVLGSCRGCATRTPSQN